jgi:hypothetical protein
VSKWSDEHSDCPQCRAKVQKGQLVKLFLVVNEQHQGGEGKYVGATAPAALSDNTNREREELIIIQVK